MSTAVIFGFTGQDGFYLRKLLKEKDVSVLGISRKEMDIDCSLYDFDSLTRVLKKIKPEYIFNFAAISSTKHDVIFENHATISTGTCNLLEAVRQVSPYSRVLVSGSGLQFKNMGAPLDENNEFCATSPYAIERNYTCYLSRYYRDRFDIRVYFPFLFTHDSPKRTECHMSSKIALAAKAAANGKQIKLLVGDMSVEKEYLFAGDAVKAMWQLINQDHIYEAVIGTGKTYSIKDWAKACFDYVGLDYRDYIYEDNNFKSEYHRLVSNPKKIMSLGWKPKINFTDLVKIMMEEI